jgi:hypothetical protein
MVKYSVIHPDSVSLLLSYYKNHKDIVIDAPTPEDQLVSERAFYGAQIRKIKRTFLGHFEHHRRMMYSEFIQNLYSAKLADDSEDAQILSKILVGGAHKSFPVPTRFFGSKTLEFTLSESVYEGCAFVDVHFK